jgi:hypothetical protein
MAIQAKVGAFNTTTDAATSTVSITGLGFQPTAVIFWWTKSTSTGSDVVERSHISTGMGWAISNSARAAITMQSEDASSNSDTDRRHDDSQCVVIQLATGGVDGSLDFDQFTSDGFDLVVDDQFVASYRIHYLALGGSAITNTFSGTFTVPNASGDIAVTAPGFTPDVLICATARVGTTPPSGTTNAAISFGFAVPSFVATVSAHSRHNVSTMNTHSYGASGLLLAPPGVGGAAGTLVDWGLSVKSWDTNGFTLDKPNTTGAGDIIVHYLAIQGGDWAAGEALTQTDTSTQITVSGLSFQPAGGLVFSHCNSEGTTAMQSENRLSIGGFSATAARGAQAHLDEDNTSGSEVSLAVEHDAVYANISTATAIQGLMDVQSVNDNGVSFIMDVADPAQNWFAYLLVGEAAASGQPVRLAKNTLGRQLIR